MNNVNLLGRLTKDPEVRYTQSNVVYATFTLAVRKKFKAEDGKDADFIKCIAWNKTAELISMYVKKGEQIGITGRLQTRDYDANDGTKRYVTEVIAEEVEFLGGKKEEDKTNIHTDAREDMTWNLDLEADDFNDL